MTVQTAIGLIGLLLVSGCASRPHPLAHRPGGLHLMADRDVAEILLAHCETGVELLRAIEISPIQPGTKTLISGARQDEERDVDEIRKWIDSQPATASAVGQTEAAEVRSQHSGAAMSQLEPVSEPADQYALRLLMGHQNEERDLILHTPVKDRALRKIVDVRSRRLDAQVKELSLRIASAQNTPTSRVPND